LVPTWLTSNTNRTQPKISCRIDGEIPLADDACQLGESDDVADAACAGRDAADNAIAVDAQTRKCSQKPDRLANRKHPRRLAWR